MSGGAPVPQPVSKEEAKILSIADLEREGSKKLPGLVRDFYNSGSRDQHTLHANSTSLTKLLLRSRVLTNVSNLDSSTTLWGSEIPFPLGIAPAGIAAMAHPDGETATARACRKGGSPMAVSSFANYHIDDIRAAAGEGVPLAMQVYTMKDRGLMLRILQRAEERGCKAIFLTADSPVLGYRYNEHRNDFRTPHGLGFPNLEISSEAIRQNTHDSSFRAFNNEGHSWDIDIPWIRARSKMQIWVKGVMCGEDVVRAVEAGCDGVVVSNHGGRQLDNVPATVDVLAECVAAARGSIGVHVDGGFRSGADIFRALALGAQCVWVGRPALWGLAYDGQAGVEKMLDILLDEFRQCMALCGCRTLKDIERSCLARINAEGVLAKL